MFVYVNALLGMRARVMLISTGSDLPEMLPTWILWWREGMMRQNTVYA